MNREGVIMRAVQLGLAGAILLSIGATAGAYLNRTAGTVRDAMAGKAAAALVAPSTVSLHNLQACIAEKQAKGLPAFELCKGD